MANIIIIFSTTDGHTRKISQYLQQVIEQQDNKVTLVSIDEEADIELQLFDKIVIGASIRYGKHHVKVYDFIESNLQTLNKLPSAFFSVNVVARKAEKNLPDTNPYVKKFLTQIAWKPKQLAVFAGKINYKKYRMLDRFMIRLIMFMTRGPTDPATNIEFTNWQQVDNFASIINEM